jgi:hypothetical protein
MKRMIVVGAVSAACLAGTVAIAPAAWSDDDGERALIGVRLDFTSATEASGTFAVCCEIDDAGAASARITAYEPEPGGRRARFTATNTFNGAKGSFTIRLRGTTGPLGGARHIARGDWRVIAGSGGYAGLRGGGRLRAVTDQATGALTAIDSGELRLP